MIWGRFQPPAPPFWLRLKNSKTLPTKPVFCSKPLILKGKSVGNPTCLHFDAQTCMAHGKSPKPAPCRQCKQCPHCPPLKYYTVSSCKVGGRVAGCCLLSADGPRVGPAAEGHGSGGATNKIFNSPHCPHDPQIFKFIFYVYWPRWLVHVVAASVERLRYLW
jgi:hypothetical protein